METSLKEISDIYYLAALCAAPGLGRTKLPKAIGLLGSAKKVFLASEQELVALNCFTQLQISKFLEARKLELPEGLRRFCQREGVQLLTLYAEGYPESLKHIEDPPLVLYVLGEIPAFSYAVAIVGSRDCSEYGLEAAAYFSNALARKGIPIISGGARGIDTAAHQACLAAGGQTIAVLGCGIDVIYPAENKELFRRIASQGAVITEYAPGTKPIQYNFPARNRIVVGLSQAVLVVEARRKSGALITAHIAADEGREVYAVPGNIFTRKSLGCHDLIRKGVKPVDMPQDILEDYQEWLVARQEIGIPQSLFDYKDSAEESAAAEQQRLAAKKEAEAQDLAKKKQLEETKRQKLLALSPSAQKIYQLLTTQALSLDEIIESSGEDFMTVSLAVLDLQLAGLAKEEGMQSYRRI